MNCKAIESDTAYQKVSFFIEEANRLGFIAVGFSGCERPLYFDAFCDWVESGRQGEMRWLGRHLDLRGNPERLLEGCQTVISLAFPYGPNKPSTPDGYTASRYAEPKKRDYHRRLKKLGKRLARTIADLYPGSKARICVDSAPILERSFAFSSGTGFIGKNNMFIIPGHGSYLFLMEILTTAVLPRPENPSMECQCGTCKRCVDACPTGALEDPFSLNASRCLSYLTIEHGGSLDREIGKKMGRCFFGCDVCQEVCPFNPGASARETSLPSTEEILKMDANDFEREFGKTAFARAGHEKIKRNIDAVRSTGER
jgi:epoxyqueuosine reductase